MGSESIKKFLPLAVAAIAGLVAIFLINAYVSQRTEEAKKMMIIFLMGKEKQHM